MVENYNPTRKEVLREAFSEVSLKNIGSKLRQVGTNFIGVVSAASICPYISPTAFRVWKEDKSSGKNDVADKIELTAGLLGAIAITYAQAEGYLYAVEHDHPEALLIPVATNVASGVYEIGRKIYNNTRQKLISKHNAESLESALK